MADEVVDGGQRPLDVGDVRAAGIIAGAVAVLGDVTAAQGLRDVAVDGGRVSHEDAVGRRPTGHARAIRRRPVLAHERALHVVHEVVNAADAGKNPRRREGAGRPAAVARDRDGPAAPLDGAVVVVVEEGILEGVPVGGGVGLQVGELAGVGGRHALERHRLEQRRVGAARAQLGEVAAADRHVQVGELEVPLRARARHRYRPEVLEVVGRGELRIGRRAPRRGRRDQRESEQPSQRLPRTGRVHGGPPWGASPSWTREQTRIKPPAALGASGA